MTPLADRHLQRCLRCQAERAKYRKLRRLSLSLKAKTIEPPEDLLRDIFCAVQPPATVHVLRKKNRKAMYVSGFAMSAAAGAIVVASRLVGRERAAS